MSQGPRHDPVAVLNERHADDLLAIARAFGGVPDATSAQAERVDRQGIDLTLDAPGGRTDARVDFGELVSEGDSMALRAAFADLATRARAALTGGNNGSSG